MVKRAVAEWVEALCRTPSSGPPQRRQPDQAGENTAASFRRHTPLLARTRKGTAVSFRRHTAMLGAHADDVLREFGHDEAGMARLRNRGAV